MKGAGGPGEAEEVPAEAARRIRRHVGIEEEAAELLACAQNLLAPVTAPARIGGGQIVQLQGTLESDLEPVRPAGFVRPDRALHLASHVPELFDQLQACPAPVGGVPVQDSRCHRSFRWNQGFDHFANAGADLLVVDAA